MFDNVPEAFYRVSVKGLILDDQNRFLLCKEDNGYWGIPGGGLDHGESFEEGFKREIMEEMGLEVEWFDESPYFVVNCTSLGNSFWMCHVIYKAKLKSLDFTPSNECLEIKFFGPDDIETHNVYANAKDLAKFHFNRD